MAVRNFWIDADIDGRKTMLSGGPRAKDGGMLVNIYQRDDGGIHRALRIECMECGDGTLKTVVLGFGDDEVQRIEIHTER